MQNKLLKPRKISLARLSEVLTNVNQSLIKEVIVYEISQDITHITVGHSKYELSYCQKTVVDIAYDTGLAVIILLTIDTFLQQR